MPYSTDADSWRTMYPFTSRWHDLGAHRIHYVDEGQGPAVVFVHGNPTWSFYWRKLMYALRERYRIVALDHLGSGWSDRPRGYSYRLADHSHNLTQLLKALRIRDATLVGHDWGGAIGLHAGLLGQPGTFRNYFLCNTGAFPPPRIPRRIAICRGVILGRFLVQGLNVFPRAALRMALHYPQRLSAAERQGILAPYRTWRSRAGIYGFLRDIPTSPRHPTFGELERIEQALIGLRDRPVSLVWGMRDWCFDMACLERLLAGIPHAELTRIEDAGHWVVEDAPQEVLSVLSSFLNRFGSAP